MNGNPILYTDPSGERIPWCDIFPHGVSGCPPKTYDYNETVPPPGVSWNTNLYLESIHNHLAPLFDQNDKLVIGDAAQFKIKKHQFGCTVDTEGKCIPGTAYNQNYCGQVVLSAIIRSYDPEITTEFVVDQLPGASDGTGTGDYTEYLKRTRNERLVGNVVTASDPNQLTDIKNWISGNGMPMTYLNIINGSAGTNPDIGGKVGANPGRNISHWVLITGISKQWEADDNSGWNWIRIYNPFDNHPEYYWWGDFKPAWRQTNPNYEALVMHVLPPPYLLWGR